VFFRPALSHVEGRAELGFRSEATRRAAHLTRPNGDVKIRINEEYRPGTDGRQI